MEKQDYRDNLEQLNEAFPEKGALKISDVAKYLGLDRRTVIKKFSREFEKSGGVWIISKVRLARLLS